MLAFIYFDLIVFNRIQLYWIVFNCMQQYVIYI